MQTTISKTHSSALMVSWVNAAQSGDKLSFEKLYQETYRRLYLFCLRMTNSKENAEEAVQETYIKAWLALAQYRNEGDFYYWLRQIASRVVIDKLRLKESQIWQNSSELDINYPATTNELDKKIDLEKLIALLPEGARTVLILYDIEGFAHKEIAQLTGIAIGTSKAQLSRARTLLRTQLSVSKLASKQEDK
ncbi:RNA polymerase sigma factor [Aliikangiella sp. IMCC44359]|uniref:RNA polymerase sigma factor n=1 Tax=Aliikangiella sp. IMCC44359 TaxID=3459125 RepID=UPI00403AE438